MRSTPVELRIEQASASDVAEVAAMVGELLHEIMTAIDEPVFDFDLNATISRLGQFLAEGTYRVFIARDDMGQALGFVALTESHALYAGGAFGTIPELYVRSAFRSGGVGSRLIKRAKALAAERGWKRLEVTTPPLPQFDRTLAFYHHAGFSVTGGRKLKAVVN